MKRKIQLLVIGGGPAGSMAAATAAKAGLEVFLIERDGQAGRPLCCAEAISHVGLTSFVEPDNSFIATGIRAVTFTVGTGYQYRHNFSEPIGYVLDRTRFDPYLADQAAEAGAEVVFETSAVDIELSDSGPARVTLEDRSGQRPVDADFVIAADGVESMIGRRAGLDTLLKLSQSETALQYRVGKIDADPVNLEFCVGRDYAPGGYLWVFPKSSQSANIGLGLNPARHEGAELRDYLDKFLSDRYGDYEVEFESCGMVPKYQGFAILGRENLFLAGDAARALDSLAGAGIAKAMHTGQMAARTVIHAVEAGLTRAAAQKYYRDMTAGEIGGDLKFSQKAYPVFRKFSDKDWETLVKFIRDYAIKEKTGSTFDPVYIVKSALKNAPRLLRLSRHIF